MQAQKAKRNQLAKTTAGFDNWSFQGPNNSAANGKGKIKSSLLKQFFKNSLLKIKLIGSLVAISVIELLKDFIELAGEDYVTGGTKWRIVIHLTFVASGVLFALMDWIADKREFHGTHT